MAKHKILLLSSICIFIAVFAGQSISRAGRVNRTGASRSNRRYSMGPEDRRRKFEQSQREYAERLAQRRQQRQVEREKQLRQVRATAGSRSEETLKQSIGATEEQWKVIWPKFKKVQVLMHEARVSITPFTYATGGSSGRGSRTSYREGIGPEGGTAGGGGRVGAIGGEGSRGSEGVVGEAGRRGRPPSEQTPPKDSSKEEIRNWKQSGWKWSRPSERKSRGKLTKGDRTCEELLVLLQNKNANLENIGKKLDSLRNIREEATKKLIKARQELRKVLTPRQEATFVLMGWLD